MKRIRIVVSLVVLGAAFAAVAPAQPAEGRREARQETEEKDTYPMPWKVTNFVLLVGVLGYFIVKKSGAFFAGRTDEIRKGLDEAAKMKKDAEDRYAEVEKRLASIGQEIEALRTKGLEESRAEAERTRLETERLIEKVQERAGQEIASSAKLARQELRAYAAGLAVNLAEKKIRERLTPDADQVILGGMLNDLEKLAGSPSTRLS